MATPNTKTPNSRKLIFAHLATLRWFYYRFNGVSGQGLKCLRSVYELNPPLSRQRGLESAFIETECRLIGGGARETEAFQRSRIHAYMAMQIKINDIVTYPLSVDRAQEANRKQLGPLARSEVMREPRGKTLILSKEAAALRQIEASIDAFWRGDYDICITLALAAEGMASPGSGVVFARLRDDHRRPRDISKTEWISIINHERDFLKHPSNLLEKDLEVGIDSAGHAIMRALACWEPWSESMLEVKAWYMKHIQDLAHKAAHHS